jgi:uncharacterized protein YndB with AHSA1/START domain
MAKGGAMNPSASDATFSEPELVITRVFDAPRELVWRVITEMEHLAHWWGPKGWQRRMISLDLRPGGVFHYSIQTRGGQETFGISVYREIVPPERLVFINSFADENGNIVRAPFNDDWPLEVLSTWTLTERDGKTTFTIRSVPHNATEAERKAFEAGFASVQAGFAGTFDLLADYLATL